eukprot:TRINITY_DN16136_c0_g1_i1.p1 TRINITY_DN16136_c0_g1~~TRINITY_DN16136_c0_g1_i1.p1  ORF type:complete len:277 (-),score=24.35 TRINITY_DN16136_c0_g1_i1:113-943(-)
MCIRDRGRVHGEGLFESVCLFNYGGSCSEVFFGFIRRSLQTFQFSPLTTNLTKKQKLLTLILKLGIPYTQKVLDKLFTNLNFIRKQKGDNCLTKFQLFFLNWYPKLYLFIQLLNFSHNFRYLFDNSFIYYSLFDRILKQQLYKLPLDISLPESQQQAFSLSLFSHKYFMFIMFFALQFMDFFNQKTSINKPLSLNQLKPCFQNPEQISEKMMQKQKNLVVYCALCQDAAIQPVCLDVSGFIFCKKCIEEYVKQQGKCPKTGIQCTEKNLHKIITHG